MSETKTYTVPENQVGQITLAKNGQTTLFKADRDIKAGEMFFVNDPRKDAEKFAKNEEELQARLKKIPDFVLRNIVKGKN